MIKRITLSEYELVSVLASLLIFLNVCGEMVALADSVELSVFKNEAQVDPVPIQVNGQETKVWETSPEDQVLTFQSGGHAIAPSSGNLYLEVTYLDRGYGRLKVAYTGNDGNVKKPDKFTRVVLSDSGKWVTSYQRLSDLPDSVIPDIHISLERNQGNALAVAKVTLQDAPFTDAHFQYLLQEAWKRLRRPHCARHG